MPAAGIGPERQIVEAIFAEAMSDTREIACNVCGTPMDSPGGTCTECWAWAWRNAEGRFITLTEDQVLAQVAKAVGASVAP